MATITISKKLYAIQSIALALAIEMLGNLVSPENGVNFTAKWLITKAARRYEKLSESQIDEMTKSVKEKNYEQS
ncbi:hypothetical protein [uncultured Nostoc sp.]|uniref:hypothetical protein n=1 Tax=uncultured Nostoc sp. TaxID=340711 RepID=UPI0035CAF4A2